MGRHAAPSSDHDPGRTDREPGAPDVADDDAPLPPAPPPAIHPWWEHAVLAVVAALAVGGVMAWAGGPSWAAALGGLSTAVVVLAAGWLAGRLPRHGAGPG